MAESKIGWPLLATLTDDERREVLAVARRRRFPRNGTIFHEGDPGDTMHLVAKGRIGLRVTTPLGDTAMLRVLGPGDFFGEMALLSGSPRNASAVALDAVETLSIDRGRFDELRARQPGIDEFLLHTAVAEVRRLSQQLLEALYVPADKRVLRRLLDLVHLFGAGADASTSVTVPLTQDDLAQMAGTTRPTANRVLRAAQDAGVLEIGRARLDVLDRDALERRAR